MCVRPTLRCVGLALVVGWAVSVPAQDQFMARLSTVPIETRTQSAVTGRGAAAAVLNDDTLTVEGNFEGLQGPANAAWLHVGAAVGVRGPALRELSVSKTTSGTIKAAIELNAEQQLALRAGHLYIQIHSDSAPEGNLWGWLLP